MNKPIIAAAVVLGLGVAAIALAQGDGDRHRQQSPDRARLRSQVVKLRVDIEVLQLDHDADREIIVAWMKSMRPAEGMRSADPDGTGFGLSLGMMMLEAKASAGDAGAVKEMEKLGEGSAGDSDAYRKALARSAKKQEDGILAYIARKRKDYAKQAAELADKRLELAEVEKQYTESK